MDIEIDPEWKPDLPEDYKAPVDEALENIKPHVGIAFALAQNKLGTVAEIYYDWCWEDVYDMLEMVDISQEIQRKEMLKAEMQNPA